MASSAPHPTTLGGAHTLVLGGTSGIGFGVASAALAYGASTFVCSSSQDKVDNAIQRLTGLYPGAHVGGVAADLNDRATLEATLEGVLTAAVAHAGAPLDHIVMTAGSPGRLPLNEVTVDGVLEGATLRALVPMVLGKLIAANPGKFVKEAASSSISTTSGVLSKHPIKNLGPSIAWAGTLEVLTRSLAVDLAPIRVNVVTPGAIATELMDKFPAEFQEGFKQKSLVKALGTVPDIAEVYLMAMKSRFVTGQELVVDGGSLLVTASPSM